MSEQQNDNTMAEQTSAPEQTAEQSEAMPAPDEKAVKNAAKGKKSKSASKKEQARLKKEWEDSIVASKKVKQKEWYLREI